MNHTHPIFLRLVATLLLTVGIYMQMNADTIHELKLSARPIPEINIASDNVWDLSDNSLTILKKHNNLFY